MKLSTTGTVPSVLIVGWGNVTFTHPTVDIDITEFGIEQIRTSSELKQLLQDGKVTLKDNQDNNVTYLKLIKLDVDGVVESGGVDRLHLDTVDPLVTDDLNAGYEKGWTWVNSTNKKAYVCVEDTVGSAQWDRTNLEIDSEGGIVINNVTITGLSFGNAIEITLNGNTNNLVIPDLDQIYLVHINPTGNYSLTGIVAPNPKRTQKLEVFNRGSRSLAIKNNSGGSDSDNRFLIGSNKKIQSNEGISLVYDTIDNKWGSTSINI